MNINPDKEFEQYLKDPGDPELKALFEEAEDCLQSYDAKSEEVKQLSQQVQDMAFSLDLECAEWIYEIYADNRNDLEDNSN
ncbi:hypothetical protein GNF10_09725 [Nostoc sp. UCD121]|jgi:hypothetical protein|uniref:hypothetical protein n=1 Tax=unclassified Nostoc TaxID=2593658 RepID=UPI001625AAF7|nr:MULTISPECIES: hypothetical protein [unclassified Nostoc]MBC1225283.1 hypothetical protein [Nostoc sp. UCD120]MBC1276261.1 hypothetical protein [Nostoc sp. UCD121]MBC1294958.1 hypothetical protein [Nostoc sp. UCD122]